MGRLAAAIEAAMVPPPRQTCGISKVLAKLDAEDAATLIEKLAEPQEKVSHVAIVRGLAEIDIKTSTSTVRRHRAGDCQCPA